MADRDKKLRVLVVTPEVTFLAADMGSSIQHISARTGGLGDICATQIHDLYTHHVDVHLAIPNYRNVFKANARRLTSIDIHGHKHELSFDQIHLAQDRSFYYHPRLFRTLDWENLCISLAFQREVINRIIPEVQPDLIHCYDWMTGLIPAMARQNALPSLFTLYRLESPHLLLSTIEERGIDAASFWQHCFYNHMPTTYNETRDTNPVDLLTTGVFASDHTQVFSRTFIHQLTVDHHPPASEGLKTELRNKIKVNGLSAVNPDPAISFNPTVDCALVRPYSPENHYVGKLFNKLQIQEKMNLHLDSNAPLCFWPTRLDRTRPGCHLMAETLESLLDTYHDLKLQIVFVAEGDFQNHFRALVQRLQASKRVSICDFDACNYHLAYGAADFIMMPMHQAPCALPCKIGQRYGALPIAYDTGAIHDCVSHLDMDTVQGSGFLFKHFNAEGFLWAISQAMAFYQLPIEIRTAQIRRIMQDSLLNFDPEHQTLQLIEMYKRIVNHRPTIATKETETSAPAQIAA